MDIDFFFDENNALKLSPNGKLITVGYSFDSPIIIDDIKPALPETALPEYVK